MPPCTQEDQAYNKLVVWDNACPIVIEIRNSILEKSLKLLLYINIYFSVFISYGVNMVYFVNSNCIFHMQCSRLPRHGLQRVCLGGCSGLWRGQLSSKACAEC